MSVVAAMLLATAFGMTFAYTGQVKAQSAKEFGQTVAGQAQNGDFGQTVVSPAAQHNGLKDYNGCQASSDGLKHC